MSGPVREFRGTLGTNIAIAAITLLTGVIAPRLLGPAGEGELTAIQAWPLLLGTLAMLGLDSALVYFIARQPEKGRQLITTACLMGLASSLAVAAVAWFVLPFALSAQPPAVISAARVYLLIGALYAVIGLPHTALRGVGAFRAWNIFRIVPNAVLLAVLIGAGLSGHPAAIPISRWFLGGLLVTGLPVLLVVTRRLRGRAAPDRRLAPRMLRFGLPSSLATLPQTVNLRFDQLLIIALMPARWLGLYVVAVAWSGVSGLVLSAASAVLFPEVAAERDAGRQRRMVLQALHGGAAVVLVVSVLLLLATPACLPLVFGARYSPAIPSALVLAPAGAILAWSGIAEDGLRGLGRPAGVLAAEMAGAVVTVAALPPLLDVEGILGAAIASLLGYSVTAMYAVRCLHRATGLGYRRLLIPDWRDVAALGTQVVPQLSGQVQFRWRRKEV